MHFDTPVFAILENLFWLLVGLDYAICGYSMLVYKDINHMPKLLAYRITRWWWRKMIEKSKGDEERVGDHWAFKLWALCFLIPGITASFSALVGIIIDIYQIFGSG